jgi:hypothetical protein
LSVIIYIYIEERIVSVDEIVLELEKHKGQESIQILFDGTIIGVVALVSSDTEGVYLEVRSE